jgi:hypothetical protein
MRLISRAAQNTNQPEVAALLSFWQSNLLMNVTQKFGVIINVCMSKYQFDEVVLI